MTVPIVQDIGGGLVILAMDSVTHCDAVLEFGPTSLLTCLLYTSDAADE